MSGDKDTVFLKNRKGGKLVPWFNGTCTPSIVDLITMPEVMIHEMVFFNMRYNNFRQSLFMKLSRQWLREMEAR